MKKLLEDAPEAAKTALLGSCFGCAHRRGHADILAQNAREHTRPR